MYLNHVQLIGFLGKDPEKRQVRGNGDTFTVLSVATQQSWKDANDEWQSKTEWHRVVIFNENLCRIAEQYLKKGSKVYIEGALLVRLAPVHVGVCGGEHDPIRPRAFEDIRNLSCIAYVGVFGPQPAEIVIGPFAHERFSEQTGCAEDGHSHSAIL